MRYHGQCHCGKLKASFETQKTPTALGVRTCQCSFCRRVGAVNISDPEGEVFIEALPDFLVRYRFALQTADFLICRDCGVYIAAVTGEGNGMRSTINIAGLAITAFSGVEEAPVQYGAETAEDRITRRARGWTPTRFSDAELNASYYGPH